MRIFYACEVSIPLAGSKSFITEITVKNKITIPTKYKDENFFLT